MSMFVLLDDDGDSMGGWMDVNNLPCLHPCNQYSPSPQRMLEAEVLAWAVANFIGFQWFS